MNEPKKSVFFCCAIFEIKFNKEGKFSNSQWAFLPDLPPQEDLVIWLKIKMLKAALGLRNVEFDSNSPKETYL